MATKHPPLHRSTYMRGGALRDYLVLALDQVKTGPPDKAGLVYLLDCLQPAIRLASARLEAISK